MTVGAGNRAATAALYGSATAAGTALGLVGMPGNGTGLICTLPSGGAVNEGSAPGTGLPIGVGWGDEPGSHGGSGTDVQAAKRAAVATGPTLLAVRPYRRSRVARLTTRWTFWRLNWVGMLSIFLSVVVFPTAWRS